MPAPSPPKQAMPERDITAEAIRDAVGPSAFERGRTYQRQGRVRRVESVRFADGFGLVGEVRGSGDNVYEQEILMLPGAHGARIDGNCTCPVGYDCKHVAAVCLAWLDGSGKPTPSASFDPALLAREWLGFVERGTPEPAADASRVVWLLDLERRGDGLECHARLVKPRSAGRGYTRGREIDIREIADGYLDRFHAATAVDHDIARLASAGCGRWGAVTLGGRPGALALQAMLESGRCYWQEAGETPLGLAPPRRLILQWEDAGSGDQIRLAAEVEGDPLVLPTEPPWYLDPDTHEAGLLDCGGLDTERLAGLLSAPPLPRDAADALSLLLAGRTRPLPIPPPSKVELRELGRVAPRPVLTVTPGDRAHAAYAVLAFDYAGIRIPDRPVAAATLHADADGHVRVERELDAENAAEARLLEAGFGIHASDAGTRRFAPIAADLLDSASAWSRLVDTTLPALAAAGWLIEYQDDFALHFDAGDVYADIADDASGMDWFGLGFGIEIDGRRLPLLELLEPVLERDWDALPDPVCVPLAAGHFVDVPLARLRPVLDTLRQLFDGGVKPAADGSLRLARHEAALLDELEQAGVAVAAAPHWRRLAARLAPGAPLAAVEAPRGLRAALRPYQRHGLAWLAFLRESGFNGVLADDMGLGKTLQTLAHLLAEKAAGRLDRPALVVAPTSLVGNWAREAARFTPDLRTLVLHGPLRHALFDQIETGDLLVTTYALLARDAERWQEIALHYLVLDEAQHVKNPRARAAHLVRGLHARHRLCLTGTPLENHLGELWTQFDFLMPGFLGDATTFRRLWRTPVERHGDDAAAARLKRRVAPFLLRRTKVDVAPELPPKSEMVHGVAFDSAQAELYENIRVAMDGKVKAAIARQGLARSHITILDALLKLRQVCCDPRLLAACPQPAPASAKFDLLFELLPGLLEDGRRILLFSQFTSMLGLIEDELATRGIAYTKLTGQTRKREAAIARFRAGEVPLFLISLKAGGVGLNLPEADTVIHYDPWWNPAAEDQATDRAHRIGQTQPVFVYKLIAEHSVEERMLALQARKRRLAAGILDGRRDAGLPALDEATLAELLAPLAAS
ncbi:MAG: DEAD/DEAH box helicase [Gammaproteobacteria bacterium]|nr:DEAD/DEAH box helicase [Gammaproteobacteria bacterium]